MGLDMWIKGEKFFWTDWENPENNRKEDGEKVCNLFVELGYWRKHPNLHGFIVKSFVDGEDNCEDIYLCEDDIEKILDANEKGLFPATDGFFFGQSGDKNSETPEEAAWGKQQYEDTKKFLEKALVWVKEDEGGVSRSIYYSSSW